jgi:N-acetylglucosaminyldiphosphoundecaprenol N-acetyl-beta-D-mannosaminyltransferase
MFLSLATGARLEFSMSDASSTTDVLDVQISAINQGNAIHSIESWIQDADSQYVCICTVHTVMECHRDSALMAIVNAAGLRTPDGMPLVWLSRRAGHKHVSRVYGPDLMLELARRSAHTGHRHFFYGGAPGVAHELAEKLSTQFPGLNVAGAYTPPMQKVGDIESAEVIDRINQSGADIVWCGLGTPKQDWWVANHRPLLNAPVLIAVGAAFDFHTGRVKQAPRWMQRNGLEWLFRLSQDPKRLWRRYILDNVRFVIQIAILMR